MHTYMPALPELTKAALTRLEKALDEENAALSGFAPPNLAELSRIKTQCLLELQMPAGMRDAELPARLEVLRQKLEVNRWLLHLHLQAVKEITSVIMSALLEAESDRTYPSVSNSAKVFG